MVSDVYLDNEKSATRKEFGSGVNTPRTERAWVKRMRRIERKEKEQRKLVFVDQVRGVVQVISGFS